MSHRSDPPRDDSQRDRQIVPRKPRTEVDEELRFHLEERIRNGVAAGMTPEAAREAALERFGDIASVRDECTQLLTADRRAQARRDWIDELRQDLHFALRSAARAPLFTLLTITTLAIGIGANAAVFGVVKSVLLNALPYAEPGRLMRIYAPFRDTNMPRGPLSAGTISDIRERQHSFTSLGAFLSSRDVTVGSGTPQVMKAMFVEPALFRTLGVSPIRGPGFRDEDANHDTATVVMLAYSTWQRLFAGDPAAIGTVIRLGGSPVTIVGVLGPAFVPPEGEADLYLALSLSPFLRNPIAARGAHGFGLIGRLRPGIAAESAQRELVSIGNELEKLYAKDNRGIGLTGVSLRDAMVGDTRTPLLVLLASAALVLLVMCANLAGALLSRTISRRKEFAVRVALGAGRARLVRQLLTESVSLSLAGGIAGLALAFAGLGLLRGVALTALPANTDLSLDLGAIAVTFTLALMTGLAFGIGPAISVGRADAQRALRDESRSTSESRRTRRIRGVLVAGQIALSLSLLAGAALLIRSLWMITTTPLGFHPEDLLTFNVQLPDTKYETAAARLRAYDALADRLRALPAVRAVAHVSQLPTMITNSNSLFIQDSPWAPNEAVPVINTVDVSEDYFRALGIPLKQGRVFSPSDRTDSPPVIIINEAMARQYWPRGNAIGAHVHIGPPEPNAPWMTVIGVVGDVRNDPTRLQPEPTMFLSSRQKPYADVFVVRTANEPTTLTSAIRRAVASFDPTIPIYKMATMHDVLGGRFAPQRLPVVLMTGFGVLTLLLASVGIYAMFANMTVAREREFGVRVALGSTRGAIARLVLRQGAVWMVFGLAAGAVGVVMAARLLRTQLFGVPAFDPIAIGLAILTLVVCAALALMLPVRKASRVDPINVLR